MGGGGGGEGGGKGGGGESVGMVRELDQTPTWAVASVVLVIILISIVIEKALHRLGQWFAKKKKAALVEALEKVKDELMILGFISLLLTFGQNYIAKICITEEAADTMLPCRSKRLSDESEKKSGGNKRHLLWDELVGSTFTRRFLSNSGSGSPCPAGKVSLVSTDALHQLHIFIFFLAAFHVIYSVVTMVLGRAKIRGWKEWESETASTDYEFSSGIFLFTHETSFVRQHTSTWNKNPALFFMVSFFRQFYRSVRKADYLAMRHGFINVHLAPGSKFDFRKYIKRSLEDDFKVVVGIRYLRKSTGTIEDLHWGPVLWASAVVFLLLNVKGWETMVWVSIMPLVIILAVGAKLQAIITTMALEIKERHVVVQGMPVVQLGDQHFWFGRPSLVLFFIHFTLFQVDTIAEKYMYYFPEKWYPRCLNAFQIIYLLWIWYEYGLNSCFHENYATVITRLCLGMGVQVLCSYVTLPLYALVSQMGSTMKKSIFDEQTSKALKNWTNAVKKKQVKPSAQSPPRSPVASPSKSPPHSPSNVVQRFKTADPTTISAVPSKRRVHPDQELTDIGNGPEGHLASAMSTDDLEKGSTGSGHTELNLL